MKVENTVVQYSYSRVLDNFEPTLVHYEAYSDLQ